MDFREWQEKQKNEQEIKESSLPFEKFYGRKKELTELRSFIESDKKIFCLYGVPLMGKTTLVKEFAQTVSGYDITIVRFFNPENPETTLKNVFDIHNPQIDKKVIIIFENFEEALIWKGINEHLHEIRNSKIKFFLENISKNPNVKVILESRFQIKIDFLTKNLTAELSSKQLGKIERQELFVALNEVYRNNQVQFDAFDEVCEKLNDHVWLIELAMQNDWLFEDIREATQHPESLVHKLWSKMQTIITRLPSSNKTLLCAFGILNPISETDLIENLKGLKVFSRNGELNNAIWSLRKKLLVVYDAKRKLYEINPFLREVCFTFLNGQKEMKAISDIPFFQEVEKPKYNNIIQVYERGEYPKFFDLIKNKRLKKEYDEVVDILKEVFWISNKQESILTEIAITYKWQKKYDKAIESLDRVIEINSKDIRALNELGILWREQGNHKKSIYYLTEAIDHEPDNPKVLNELAITYRERKEYSKAEQLLEKACKLGNVHSYNELAIVYKEQKDYQKAISYLEQSWKLGNVHSLNELGIVYKELKNYSKAIEYLEKGCEMNNIHSFSELAIILKEQKDYTKAIEILEKGLKIEHKSLVFLGLLHSVYFEMGNLEKADGIKLQALRINPNDYYFKTDFSKTQCYQKSNQLPEMKRKILFVTANPTNESSLQTDREYKIIKAEIRQGSHRDSFEFLNPELSTTITELMRAVNQKPNIIHFSGHGLKAGIIITTNDNQSQLLPISAMERLFKPLKGVTEVIILNSCYSADQAKAISEFGMYVVGNNLPIDDDAAINFSKGLYNGLSEGKDFMLAINDALIVVDVESPEFLEVIEVWKDGKKIKLGS